MPSRLHTRLRSAGDRVQLDRDADIYSGVGRRVLATSTRRRSCQGAFWRREQVRRSRRRTAAASPRALRGGRQRASDTPHGGRRDPADSCGDLKPGRRAPGPSGDTPRGGPSRSPGIPRRLRALACGSGGRSVPAARPCVESVAGNPCRPLGAELPVSLGQVTGRDGESPWAEAPILRAARVQSSTSAATMTTMATRPARSIFDAGALCLGGGVS